MKTLAFILLRALPVATAAATVIACGPGCRLTGYYLEYPELPVEGVERIAVAPVYGAGDLNPLEVGDALASELIQCPRVEGVVRPFEFQRAIDENDLTLDSESAVRSLARLLDVDAVLIAEVSEYYPYHPPRVGMIAQLFLTNRSDSTGLIVLDISRQGRAQPIANLDAGTLIQLERIHDASQREVFHRARWYAMGHDYNEEALEGGERILWIPKLYLRFASHCLVKDLFGEYSTRIEEVQRST